MKIEVKLFPTLEKYSKIKNKGKSFFYEIEKNSTVKDVIENLGIPQEYAKIIIVNGQRVEKNFLLNAGDKVVIFPLIAGG
jgi:sulfur carrier protein ThiS